MSKISDPSTNVMKNPEHESGYFEDGSDIEIAIEEETIDVQEEIVVEEYTEICYGFTKAIDELDVSNLDEPVPDHHEDKSNKGKA
jgi:hypothetical protein